MRYRELAAGELTISECVTRVLLLRDCGSGHLAYESERSICADIR